MRTLNELTEAEKQSIAKHYMNQYGDLVHELIGAAATAVRNNDSLLIAWLSDVTRGVLIGALDRMEMEDADRELAEMPVNGTIQ
jgi:hypothetical protein